MNCPKCNVAIDDDSRFCKHCGAAIAFRTASAAAPQSDPLSKAAESAEDGNARSGVYRDPSMEQDIWQGRPSFKAHFGLWAAWVVVGVALLWLTFRYTMEASKLRTAAWLLVLAAGVALLSREALIVFGNRYRLTTQRLFWHRGVLTRTTEQLELVRVDDVRLRQGVVDRIVDTGCIEIISTDATDQRLALDGVAGPVAVTEHLRRCVRSARTKGALFVENV